MASVLSSCAFLRVTYLISVCLAHEWKVKVAKIEQKFQVPTSKSQISAPFCSFTKFSGVLLKLFTAVPQGSLTL